jgi:hypothetical protein
VFGPESFQALGGLLNNIPISGAEQALLGPGGAQDQALEGIAQSQALLQQGGESLAELLDPQASVAAARREFEEGTLPAILERAPGFSSSDLQRELTRGGTDLETNVAALRQAGLGQFLQTAPAFARALGTQGLDQAAQVLGFGELGRQFIRNVSPAGDAFRTLAALQSLTGPGVTGTSQGTSSGSSTRVGILK